MKELSEADIAKIANVQGLREAIEDAANIALKHGNMDSDTLRILARSAARALLREGFGGGGIFEADALTLIEAKREAWNESQVMWGKVFAAKNLDEVMRKESAQERDRRYPLPKAEPTPVLSDQEKAIANVVWNYLGLNDPATLTAWIQAFHAFNDALAKVSKP